MNQPLKMTEIWRDKFLQYPVGVFAHNKWRQLQPRERIAVVVAVVVVVMALFVQLLWSAYHGRNQLRGEHTQLTRQLDLMRTQSKELVQLRQQPVRPIISGEALLTAVRTTTATAPGLTVQLAGERQVRAQGLVAFDAWLAWLGQVQAEYRLRIIELRVERSAVGTGMVTLNAELILP